MIRFAEVKDIDLIMNFIDTYWKKNHILAVNREEFTYEYVNGEMVNMVISEKSDGEIDGIVGFIPYGRRNRDIMIALWKVVKTDNPMLGIELLKFLAENSDAKRVSCSGINRKVVSIYEFLGYKTNTMCQWYRLNTRPDYTIAKIVDSTIPNVTNNEVALTYMKTFKELKAEFNFKEYYKSNPKPLKEDWYIEKRYFLHPIYRYMVYGIKTNSQVDTFVVFRIQECNESKVLRLVDVVGNYDHFYGITVEIDKLMGEYDVEYVDLYEAGLSAQKMEKAGWRLVKDSGNIIPNYFAPFLQENIDIIYMLQDSETVLFKADGDQDRPS